MTQCTRYSEFSDEDDDDGAPRQEVGAADVEVKRCDSVIGEADDRIVVDVEKQQSPELSGLAATPAPSVLGFSSEVAEAVAVGQGKEAKERAPVEVVKEKKLASNPRTFINSLTCFIGAATYTLPACFQNIGVIGGAVMLLFAAMASLHCMFLLIDCKLYLENVQQKKIKTYGDIGYYTFGVFGARMVDSFIMITQFGFCVCYFIVVSQTMNQVFPGISQKVYIFAMMPLLVRVSWMKSLKSLASVALMAETGMFLSLGMVMFYIMRRLLFGAWELPDAAGAALDHPTKYAQTPAPPQPLVLFNVFGLTNFFGVSICVFEGVGMVLPVYNSMQKPASFKFVWGGAMALVTSLYLFFGVFGYVAYRETVNDIILSNLPTIPLTIVVKISFCIGLYLTYPLMLFPVIEIWEEMAGRTSEKGCRQSLLWNTARSLLVCISGVLAMYVPKLNLVVALIGASGSTMLAFTLPSAFKLKLRLQDMSWFERMREAICFTIGLVGGTISTLAALKDLREAAANS